MGWNINITTQEPMTESVIDQIVSELPKDIHGGCGKQSWGWSLAVDLRLRNSHQLGLSGSYGMSGRISKRAAKTIRARLTARGYHAVIGLMH